MWETMNKMKVKDTKLLSNTGEADAVLMGESFVLSSKQYIIKLSFISIFWGFIMQDY
jgi:hypothetical protein